MARFSTFGRRMAVAGLAVVLTAGLAACGDDDDEEAGGTATTTTPSAAAPSAEIARYCEKSLAIEIYEPPGFDEVDFESLSEEEQKELARGFAKGIIPLAEETIAAAPAEIKADGNVLVDAVRRVEQTGDFEGIFGEPAVSAAEDRLHAYDLKSCGWGQANVTGVDFAFQGVPPTFEAGPVSFDFSNKGAEPHEMQIFRINDGVNEPFQGILALGEEEGQEKITHVSGTDGPILPGATDYSIAELEAGRYGMACFIPVGGGEEGPPHFTRGMFAEFRVT